MASILNGSVPAPQRNYQAAYWYVVCDTDIIVQANSTAGVAAAIKQLSTTASQSGKQLKIRATRHKFHSSAAFTCPAQESALANRSSGKVLTVGILHDNLNKLLSVDAAKYRMRVGSGMILTDLLTAGDKYNMSVQVGALPAYQGLTLAGIFSTSAHGSGDNAVQMLADMVVDLTWVDAKGVVHNSTRSSQEGRMLSGGMGLLGVITEFTLQMTPLTNTKLHTWFMRSDDKLMTDISEMLKEAPHILIFWRPDFHKYSAYLYKEADPSEAVTNPDATMTVLPSYKGWPNLVPFMSDFQTDVALLGPTRYAMCAGAYVQSVGKTWASTGSGLPLVDAVAPSNHMQSADCGNDCAWTTDVLHGTAQDNHFSIEFNQLSAWISDVQRIFWTDMQGNGSRVLDCMGPGYMWLRFGRGSDDYLSMQTGMKRPVYVQSTWLRSRTRYDYPIKHGHVLDLIEEVTLCKYKGRPHWGKNFDRTFSHPKCPIRPLFPKFDEALQLQAKYDPAKVFEPVLFTKLVNKASYSYSPGCALRNECYCTADKHCGDDFKCIPSAAMPEFKVCHWTNNWHFG